MKKTIKILLSTILLTMIFILSFSLITSAKVEEGKIGKDVTITFDTDTKVLTFFNSNPDLFLDTDDIIDNELIMKYKDKVKKVIYKNSNYSNLFKFCDYSICTREIFPKLQYYIKEYPNNFFQEYDAEKRTLTIYGNGKWDFELMSRPANELIISDGITGIDDVSGVDKINVGKSFKNFPDLSSLNKSFSAKESYIVDKNNPYLSSYEGCLYTKDFSKLLAVPAKHEVPNFHKNLSIIGNGALMYNGAKDYYLVIPWGVTAIEGELFSASGGNSGPNATVVLPDTLKNFSGDFGGGGCASITQVLCQNTVNYINDFHYEKVIPNNEYYSIYGIKPNSLKTFQNSKTYYFDNNYKMAKGWKKVNGTWYYFNDYGAAVVKIWLKSGGKWYYMQEDGTMATNKWIKWYNKWYYVGADGAMYANRKTPDGYYVNASGVWVK